MHSGKVDLAGWLLAAVAALLAVYVAFAIRGAVGLAIGAALITLVVIERRRSKVVTASLIRVVDEAGGIRGLVAWDGEGVQIGIRAEALNNGAVAYGVLWQKEPSVSFSFRPATTVAGGATNHTPAIGVSSLVENRWRSYAVEFSYESIKMEPSLLVAERKDDATIVRRIPLN